MFIYQNSWKLSVKKLIFSQITGCQPESFLRKVLHIYLSSFNFIFLFSSKWLLPRRSWNCVNHSLIFQEISAKSTIECIFLPIQLWFIRAFMQNRAFDVVLSTAFVKRTKWNSWCFTHFHFCYSPCIFVQDYLSYKPFFKKQETCQFEKPIFHSKFYESKKFLRI